MLSKTELTIIHKVITVFLILTSAVMLYQGGFIAYHTSGTVRGSEFQMLITLSNQFAYFMVWLASLAFFLISKSVFGKTKNSQQTFTD